MNKVKLKIKDIAEVKNGSTPSTKNDDYYDGDIIWITPKDLSTQNSKYIYRGERTITDEGYKSCSAVIVPKGTVLLSSRAPIGLLSIAGTELCTNQGFKNIVPHEGKVDSEFLYYYLKTKISDIEKLGSGTTFKEVSKTSLEGFTVSIPEDIPTQQKIAAVLSALDAKIELNQRINAELESMAKTLYDYWFVQFAPHKSAGGEMVWNEALKREIPKGWKVESIEGCCDIVDCLHAKKPDYEFEDENSYLLQLENIRDDGLLDLTNKYFVSKDEYQKWISRIEVTEHDILITNAGRVAATAQVPKGVKTGIGRNITAIRPKSINPTYLFLFFRSFDMKRQVKWNMDAGAFFSSLNVKGIKKLFIIRPSDDIEEQFENIVKPMRRKREELNRESQTLTELRDWLLPMLMNGQVKIQG
jgi:type I restriction enzyme S subunit